MTIVYSTASLNLWLGCSAKSAGCAHCYAAREASTRLAHLPDYEGLAEKGKWTGKLVCRGDKKWLSPLRRRKPQNYFVNSTSDTFHEDRDAAWVDRLWATMALSPHHKFLILTKRPGEALAQLTDPAFSGRVAKWADEIRSLMPPSHPCQGVGIPNPTVLPLRNVWLGASVSVQSEARQAAKLLEECPAALRWLSLEPLLEPVSLTAAGVLEHPVRWKVSDAVSTHDREEPAEAVGPDRRCGGVGPIDLVVVGGESGPNARPFDLDWAASLISECHHSNVSLYFKQAGSNALLHGAPFPTKHRKGEDPDEWPSELQVRQWPEFRRIAHAGDRKLTYQDPGESVQLELESKVLSVD